MRGIESTPLKFLDEIWFLPTNGLFWQAVTTLEFDYLVTIKDQFIFAKILIELT